MNTLKEMSSQKNKTLVLLGQEIEPGKSYQLNLNVAKLHTSSPIQVPVIVERALEDGPTVVLMAGMHGDEINGVEIIRRMIRRKLNKPLIGTIICIPIFNIFGFLSHKRELPDGRDLNRSFPGSEKGSLASQFAFKFLKEIAPHADIVFDFHTGAAQRSNFSQIRCDFKNGESVTLAQVFRPPFILDSALIAKSVREALTKIGKQYMLFEGGKSNSINEEVVEEAIDGVRRVLNHLKMRAFKTDHNEGRESIFLHKSRWLRAPMSGLFLVQVTNGHFVHKGDVIGLVMDPFGLIERKVKAPFDGYVFCVNEAPTVYRGDAILHIGQQKKSLLSILEQTNG